jgi:hypothetical protein
MSNIRLTADLATKITRVPTPADLFRNHLEALIREAAKNGHTCAVLYARDVWGQGKGLRLIKLEAEARGFTTHLGYVGDYVPESILVSWPESKNHEPENHEPENQPPTAQGTTHP